MARLSRRGGVWCVAACVVGLGLLASASGDAKSVPPVTPPTLDLAPKADGPFPLPALAVTEPVPAPVPPAPKAEKQTVDQLLNGLAELRAKKAELERQEKALVASLRERLREQKERLAKLGVEAEEPPAKVEAKDPGITIPALSLPAGGDKPGPFRLPEKK